MKHFFRISILLLLSSLCCLLSGSEDYDKWKQKQIGKFKSYRSKQDEQFHTFLKNEVEAKNTNYDFLIVSWYTSGVLRKYSDILLKNGNSVLFLTRKDLRIIEKNH